ncbi:hypothetical protein IJO12_03585 [bacterium]|nr:hypothetical protein [bacterium]
MDKINKQNIKNTNFGIVKPKQTEVPLMKDKVKNMVKKITLRAEREVPEYGDFAPVYEEFKNTDTSLKATDFMLKIVKPPSNIKGHEKLRYIELSAYQLPMPYKMSRLIAKGTKEEILQQLKEEDFFETITKNFSEMSRNLGE